ncbi:hypothetical protein [Chitinimonas sp. BJYL2]|uniref:hypothetical protein n=1 Tax=Chitinimonas sp. BJYL2 TaxID=2976696 RepID=UPI0022B57043|nr:hypothetical protein [Chitinimonas sp. BJYL2]
MHVRLNILRKNGKRLPAKPSFRIEIEGHITTFGAKIEDGWSVNTLEFHVRNASGSLQGGVPLPLRGAAGVDRRRAYPVHRVRA